MAEVRKTNTFSEIECWALSAPFSSSWREGDRKCRLLSSMWSTLKNYNRSSLFPRHTSPIEPDPLFREGRDFLYDLQEALWQIMSDSWNGKSHSWGSDR